MDAVKIAREGRIATVTFDRGDGANALSSEVMEALTDAARELDRDPDLSAVVLTGTPALFSLGYDLDEARARVERPARLAELRRATRIGRDLCRAWASLEPMTFCAVEGWCVGGGAVLAAHCDLRVLGDGATFYLPEVERGLNLSWGGAPRLTALLGPARAKRLIALAEKVGAAKAEVWGLADRTAPAGEAREAALAWAREAAALPPIALRMCKLQVEAAAHALSEATSALDRDQFTLSSRSADSAEAVLAFLEKRPPQFQGD